MKKDAGKWFQSSRLFLLALFPVAFFLRFYLLWQNLFFGPEQGRDFLVIRDITIYHKITLIGSKTDIEGIFHGPLFYYIASIPFLISHGNPVFVSAFFIVLQCLTVFFIFLLGKELLSKRTGYIAATLFTFSYACIVYARWLSNPPLSIPLSALFLLFVVKFLKGKQIYLIFTAIIFGLLAQVQFLNILFLSFIGIAYLLVYRKQFLKTKISYLIAGIFLMTSISFGTYVLFDIRHQFLIAHSIINLLTGHSGYYNSFAAIFLQMFYTLIVSSQYLFFPFLTGIGGLTFLISTIVILKDKRKDNAVWSLLLYLFVPLIVLVLLHHSILEHYFIPLFVPMILLVAYFIDWLFKKNKMIGLTVLFCIVFANMLFYAIYIPRNNYIFFQTTQPDLKYSDELAVIDYMYQQAQEKPFAYQAYTIPYWTPDAWRYLFWYFGQSKYGYQPIEQEHAKLLFVITQSDNDSLYEKLWLRDTVSKWGTLQKTSIFGALSVQRLMVR